MASTNFDKPLDKTVSSKVSFDLNGTAVIASDGVNKDLYNISSPGLYRYASNALNVPSSTNGYVGYIDRNGYKVLFAYDDNGNLYTNKNVNSSWSGWQGIADTSTKEGIVSKANCNYTYNGVRFYRTGNVLMVKVIGFISLPAQQSTICTIPSGFRPSSLVTYDAIGLATNEGTGIRALRFALNANGTFGVYNYGSALTNNNLEVSFCVVI